MRDKLESLKKNLNKVIFGKEHVIDDLLVALCAGGNVLMEDVPGVGKTTLAKALALSIHGKFNRIQFTPDMLPSDVIGSSIYNPKDAEFHFRHGPVFTNILLADEINRASPRTQSALLEAMNENQVSIEGRTYKLERPFLVIATENPIEYHGTYPLPEAQLDRFAMQLELGYPDKEHELEVLYSRKKLDPIDEIQAVISCEEICGVQDEVRSIDIERTVAEYALELIASTRNDSRIRLGASPRALLALSRCAQAKAYMNERDYVIPDDVKSLAVKILSHRIVLENKEKYSGVTNRSVIEDILSKTKVPA
jgi:MoxR-like ATPase